MPIHVDPAGASLHGKIAVVTGGAGSIGSAVVSRLVSEGVRVIAVDQDRAPDPAAAGVNYLRGDVTHPATAQRAVATAEAAFGGLDLLVNAASSSHAGGLADMDLTCWNRVLAVNLTGTPAGVPGGRARHAPPWRRGDRRPGRGALHGQPERAACLCRVQGGRGRAQPPPRARPGAVRHPCRVPGPRSHAGWRWLSRKGRG